MDSLFPIKAHVQRRRAISHGGLGGLVAIRPNGAGENDSSDGKATWPRWRRKDSPAIGTEDEKQRPSVIVTGLGCKNESTITCIPRSRFARTPLSGSVCADSPNSGRYWLSPLSQNPPQCVHSSLPVTPKTPNFHFSSPAIELPGSLLLPSQGFPQQNPPLTPPRQTLPYRRKSEESSVISSVPELSISACSDSDDAAMSQLGTFSSALARLRRPLDLPISLTSASTESHESSNKTFSSMTVDELLNRLPHLSVDTIRGSWLRAMRTQHEKIRELLNDATDVRLDTHYELKHFDEDMRSIADDARKISATYEKAIQSVESLQERDTKLQKEEIETLEREILEARDQFEVISNDNHIKREKILELKNVIEFLVRTFGSFMSTNRHIFDPANALYQDVTTTLSNYEDFIDPTMSTTARRYVHIPEDEHLGNLARTREVQNTNLEYRDLAVEQHKALTSRSHQLEHQMKRFEQCVNAIKQRDHEIMILALQNEDLRQKAADFESGMRVSRTTKAVQESLFKDHAEMQWTLSSLKNTHEEEIQKKDAEIAKLRRQLGSAAQEVLARKADVKNVITHTQALLSPNDGPERMTLSNHLAAKALKIKHKDKGKKWQGHGNFPNSMSMTSLSFFPSKVDLSNANTKSGEGTGYSDKETAPSKDKQVVKMQPRDELPVLTDTIDWGCGIPGVPQRRRSIPDLRDRNLGPRPRTDSLGVVANYMRTPHTVSHSNGNSGPTTPKQLASPIMLHKELPPHPPPQSEEAQENIRIFVDKPDPYDYPPQYLSPNFQQQNSFSQQFYGPGPALTQQQPTFLGPGPTQPSSPQPHKRILSTVPEMSVEGSLYEGSISDTISVSSSHQEALRSGLDALSVMDFERRQEREKEHQRAVGGEIERKGVRSGRGRSEEGREVMGNVTLRREVKMEKKGNAATGDYDGQMVVGDGPAGAVEAAYPSWTQAAWGKNYLL